MAEKLNEKMVLRLYHCGPGTLWTNLGDKNMTFMLLIPGNAISGQLGGNSAPSDDERRRERLR
jgi:hypothetical protein